jgi:nitrite reductase/ring-hydroxylating ferredoxin subunit
MPEQAASRAKGRPRRRAAASAASTSPQSSLYAQAFAALESISGLERLSNGVASAIAPLTRQRTLMDLLHGRWLGHALHPAISDLPIGMWSGVPLLDVLGDDRGATMLTAAGCVAAGATALTGTADWSTTVGRDRRLGMVHGLANSTALLIQLGALTARMRGRRRTGQILSLVGVSASGAAAFLGGELVFGRGLAVDHTAWRFGPSKWTPVIADADLGESAMQAVEVEGRQVLLARVDGAVCAMENTCSHAGGPLAEGTREHDVVECPWHGSRFRLSDGAVVGGPATFPQPRLQVRERKGQIEVRGRSDSD